MRTASERFWCRVAITPACWLWQGETTKPENGYGRFRTGVRGGRVVAHRWAYEEAHGSIPAGLELDHLCRTRLCVRPDHLEPVTPYVNFLRGENPLAHKARSTHCKAGHALAGDNIRLDNGGRSRRCLTCQRAYEKARER